jgi:hypothetical protein
VFAVDVCVAQALDFQSPNTARKPIPGFKHSGNPLGQFPHDLGEMNNCLANDPHVLSSAGLVFQLIRMGCFSFIKWCRDCLASNGPGKSCLAHVLPVRFSRQKRG